MSGFIQEQSSIKLTTKQESVLSELRSVVSQIGIEVRINEPLPEIKDGVVALDVEHDESGGFVGCGFYFGSGVAYYYSDCILLSRLPFLSFRIVAHNGVSDIECLRTWGANVTYEQLVWDTMLLGHCIDSSLKDYSLKGMAKRELGIVYPSYDEIVGKRGLKAERITLDKQPLELVSLYNSLDVFCTWGLYEKQKKNIVRA